MKPTPVLFNGFPNTEYGRFVMPTQPVVATTDDQGRFTWPHAPRDTVECSVLLPGGTDPQPFEWDANKDDPLEVHLKP